MNAPFFKYGLFGDNVSLIVAFAIGIAFGFVLERAGFGNARVLAAQFYFRDLRVLKVMFTAIVTAMVGLFVLARVGFVDLSLVYLTPTFVWPQVIGGLVLGAGFIIGGYCPGTSCVSAATGRIDGMVYVAGMIGGLLGFAEVYPRITEFAHSTPMGQLTLAEFLHIPYGVLVLAVVLMALGAFIAAEWAELKVGGKAPDADSLTTRTRRFTPARRLALGFVVVGLFAAVAGNPYRGPFATVDTRQLAIEAGTGANRIQPDRLAGDLIEGRNDYVLVDVRDAAAFARYHLPGALHVPLATLAPGFVARSERVICYGDDEAPGAEAALLLRAAGQPAYTLAGGLAAWQSTVLFPAAPPEGASAAVQVEYARRVAIAKQFGGAPRAGSGAAAPAALDLPAVVPAAPPVPAAGNAPVAPRRKKEGC